MKNEVYGQVILDVSRVSKSSNKDLAILESYYELNEWNIENVFREFLDSLGLRLHNGNVQWDKFFNEDE